MFRSGNRNSALKGSIIGLLALAVCGLAVPAQATVFTLVDDNSSAEIDTGSQAGMSKWTVDGVDHLAKQWFWYRVGSGAEASIDTLTVDFELATDTNGKGLNNLFVRYKDLAGTFTIEINYNLDGGVAGDGNADIAENITITNTSGASLDFHFFQYSDFDLGGTPDDDTIEFINANTVRQTDDGVALSETVATPGASHFEAELLSATLDSLNDGVATTLSDTPLIGGSIGPGNVTWAYQWDFTLAASGPGSDFQISKDKRIGEVPEPSTLSVLALGLAVFAYRRRRQNRV